MRYLVLGIIVYAISLLLKLNVYFAVATLLLGCITLPFHIRLYNRAKREKRRFYELTEYMDALLYSFLREEKIEKTFEDLAGMLEKSQMLSVVQRALEHMKLTFDETQVYRDGLRMVEEVYPCSRLEAIHNFMYHVECYGGEIARPVEIFVEDKNCWEKRVIENMQERKRLFIQVVMSVIASLIICGMILYLPIRNMDISSNFLVQGIAVIILFLDEMIILRAQKYLAEDWTPFEQETQENEMVEKMRRRRNFRMRRSRRLSLILGAAALPVCVVLFLLLGRWAGLCGLVIALLCFNQHHVERWLLDRTLTKEIKRSFPLWLLDMVLLLQTENVQVSIRKSIFSAPPILNEELQKLNEELELNPESVLPYHDFLGDFHVPEVHTAMTMLYSLSMGNSSHADKQLSELIQRNLSMMDEAEREVMKNRNARMYLLFLAPILTASVKLLVDMLIVMFSFLTTLSI